VSNTIRFILLFSAVRAIFSQKLIALSSDIITARRISLFQSSSANFPKLIGRVNGMLLTLYSNFTGTSFKTTIPEGGIMWSCVGQVALLACPLMDIVAAFSQLLDHLGGIAGIQMDVKSVD
jgi:hypothetical protein